MYHLDNESGVSTFALAPVRNTQRLWFTEGGNGNAISYPGADWFNMVQAELLSILDDAGITPDKGQLNQISQAIRKMATDKAEDYFKELAKADGYKLVGRCKSVAELRTIRPTEHGQRILVDAYYEGGTTGGGEFVADLQDLVTPDDGGTCFVVANNGGRWIKVIKDKIAITDFGAVGDGVTDDTASIQNALNTGLNVVFPEPAKYWLISDTLYPTQEGQILEAISNKAGQIRNLSNDKYLLIIGLDKPLPRVAINGLSFYGNKNTKGGIRVNAASTKQTLETWTDASKNCSITNVSLDFIGDGTALELYSWCNEVINLTIYDGCKNGVHLDYDANQNNLSGIYITKCDGFGFCIGGNGSRISRGNTINGLVVQQCGGNNEAVCIVSDAENTVINGLYLEKNNKKNVSAFLNIKSSARATVVNGVSSLSGGSNVIVNSGIGTVISGVISSKITGSIVENRDNGSVVALSIGFSTPDDIGTGKVFSDLSTGKTGVCITDNSITDTTIESFAPILQFRDKSSGVLPVQFKYDQHLFKFESDQNNDDSFSRTLFSVNTSSPEFVSHCNLRPLNDAQLSLGLGNRRWSNIYSANGVINTSDQRLKQNINEISDEVIRAWRKVDFCQYKWIESVKSKQQNARAHIGLVAQKIKIAFESEGLDACDYGLLCYDKWDEIPEVLDANGDIIQHHEPAGDRWGIRPEECLFLEAESQRRRLKALEQRLAQLEAA